MFSFLNRNRTTPKISKKEIKNFLSKGFPNPQINLWIDEQIIFQVMLGKHYTQHGFQANTNDFTIVHFFNKSKTNTKTAWKKFQNDETELFYFEEPKGVHNYLKNIGIEPTHMEREINNAIEYYELEPEQTIKIEFVSY